MSEVWEPPWQAFAEGGTAAGLDFTARWYFQVPWEEVSPEWQTLFDRNVDEWHALAASALTFPKLDYDCVRRLAVRTLLLSAGKNSGSFNDLVDGRLERLLPHAERLIIPDVSHEMFLDDAPRRQRRCSATSAGTEAERRHQRPPCRPRPSGPLRREPALESTPHEGHARSISSSQPFDTAPRRCRSSCTAEPGSPPR